MFENTVSLSHVIGEFYYEQFVHIRPLQLLDFYWTKSSNKSFEVPNSPRCSSSWEFIFKNFDMSIGPFNISTCGRR
jgi:hypothetical protein